MTTETQGNQADRGYGELVALLDAARAMAEDTGNWQTAGLHYAASRAIMTLIDERNGKAPPAEGEPRKKGGRPRKQLPPPAEGQGVLGPVADGPRVDGEMVPPAERPTEATP